MAMCFMDQNVLHEALRGVIENVAKHGNVGRKKRNVGTPNKEACRQNELAEPSDQDSATKANVPCLEAKLGNISLLRVCAVEANIETSPPDSLNDILDTNRNAESCETEA
jgi:hypothetical protein